MKTLLIAGLLFSSSTFGQLQCQTDHGVTRCSDPRNPQRQLICQTLNGVTRCNEAGSASTTTCQTSYGVTRCTEPQDTSSARTVRYGNASQAPAITHGSRPDLSRIGLEGIEQANRTRLLQAQAESVENDATANRRFEANGKRALPSEIDLRAAYCVGALGSEQSDDKLASPIIEKDVAAAIGTEKEESMLRVAARIKSQSEARDRRLTKLRDYLEPRVPHLVPEGILAAINSGVSDYREHNKPIVFQVCMRRCSDAAEGDQAASCFKSCRAEGELGSRLARCDDTTFLPY